MIETIVNKMCREESPQLGDCPTFHIIDNNYESNPWIADSYKLTPADIKILNTEFGFKMFATPHLGLHRCFTSFVSLMGGTVCMFTSNQSEKDVLSVPEFLGSNGMRVSCSKQKEGKILSPYLELDKNGLKNSALSQTIKSYLGYSSIASLQYHSNLKAFGGTTNIVLDNEIISSNFVGTVLELLAKNQKFILQGTNHIDLFDRYVSTDGTVMLAKSYDSCAYKTFLEMKDTHKRMIENDLLLSPNGYLPIKEVIIFLDSLRCYSSQFNGSQANAPMVGNSFSISGVSMINYLKGATSRLILQRMYEVVYREFEWLPLHMRLVMIPGGMFSFTPSSAEHDVCNAVDCVASSYSQWKQLCGKMSSVKESEKLLAIKDIEKSKQQYLNERKIFNSVLQKRRGFTQFDVLEGEHVPENVFTSLQHLSFGDIRKFLD
ncbi:MAG: hypothetical protein WCO65_00190 [bacterium]